MPCLTWLDRSAEPRSGPPLRRSGPPLRRPSTRTAAATTWSRAGGVAEWLSEWEPVIPGPELRAVWMQQAWADRTRFGLSRSLVPRRFRDDRQVRPVGPAGSCRAVLRCSKFSTQGELFAALGTVHSLAVHGDERGRRNRHPRRADHQRRGCLHLVRGLTDSRSTPAQNLPPVGSLADRCGEGEKCRL